MRGMLLLVVISLVWFVEGESGGRGRGRTPHEVAACEGEDEGTAPDSASY